MSLSFLSAAMLLLCVCYHNTVHVLSHLLSVYIDADVALCLSTAPCVFSVSVNPIANTCKHPEAHRNTRNRKLRDEDMGLVIGNYELVIGE